MRFAPAEAGKEENADWPIVKPEDLVALFRIRIQFV